jgi:hypothetical protein
MRLRLPSPALVIACVALLLGAGGVAYGTTRATGQLVNVVDPGNAAQAAKVDATGHLLVGDGAGSLTLDGIVRETALTSLVHIVGAGGGDSSGCQTVATPPSGKAWVLKSMAINVISQGSTAFGPYQYVVVYPNATCNYPYSAVFTPTSLGLQQWNFEPGLAIRGALSVTVVNTTLSWELTAEGYVVSAGSVPPAAEPGGPTPTGATPDPGH